MHQRDLSRVDFNRAGSPPDGDRDRARPGNSADEALCLSAGAEADPALRRRQRLQPGGGQRAVRRQRQRPARGPGGAGHQDRDQEPEHLQGRVHAALQYEIVRRRRCCGTAAPSSRRRGAGIWTPASTRVHALEGGGARLPVFPGPRPDAGGAGPRHTGRVGAPAARTAGRRCERLAREYGILRLRCGGPGGRKARGRLLRGRGAGRRPIPRPCPTGS